MKLIAIAGLGVLLAGCVGQRPAWEHYDACSTQTAGFAAMAECGKRSRNAECAANSACSNNGNAIVLYADSLAASVRSGEMSQAEATRRWLEYRSTQQANMIAGNPPPRDVYIRRF